MRIVMAASIYPPEIGGPATYAAALKESLEKQGHAVDLHVFSRLRKYPSGVRHVFYTYKLLRAARRADCLIAFDVLTVGLPAAIVRAVTGIPAVARVGGDFLWERYVERTGDLLPLPLFYKNRKAWNGKDAFLFRIVGFVLSNVIVVFSSAWIRDIWKDAYGIGRAEVIENAFPARENASAPTERNFLFYGRHIKLKNAVAFRRAFENVRKTSPDIVLEEGTLPHAELMERMKSCYAVAVPSVSDVTPNTVIDAVRFGKPFLLTKHSAYAEKFRDCGVIVDPLDEKDMERGITELLDPAAYERMLENAARQYRERTYDEVARDFMRVLQGSV